MRRQRRQDLTRTEMRAQMDLWRDRYAQMALRAQDAEWKVSVVRRSLARALIEPPEFDADDTALISIRVTRALAENVLQEAVAEGWITAPMPPPAPVPQTIFGLPIIESSEPDA